jgi:putative DNA primase/helicase
LHADERRQAEHLQGKWIVELAELHGRSKADRDATKAFITRQVDRVRHAYAYCETAQPRQCIIIGTTNESEYLSDPTGARRWWPIRLSKHIDLAKLRAERDQLWAEAAYLEAQNQSEGAIRLPQHLWAAAAVEQEERREKDPWEDELANVKGTACNVGMPDWHEQRIHSSTVFSILRVEASQQTTFLGKRLKDIMVHHLGWEYRKNVKINGVQGKGYVRSVDAPMPSTQPDRTLTLLMTNSEIC